MESTRTSNQTHAQNYGTGSPSNFVFAPKDFDDAVQSILGEMVGKDEDLRNILFTFDPAKPLSSPELRDTSGEWLSLALDMTKNEFAGTLKGYLEDLSYRLYRRAEEDRRNAKQNLANILQAQQKALDQGYEEREGQVHKAYQAMLTRERERALLDRQEMRDCPDRDYSLRLVGKALQLQKETLERQYEQRLQDELQKQEEALRSEYSAVLKRRFL